MENENFYFNFKDDILNVKRFAVGGQTSFRVTFPVEVPFILCCISVSLGLLLHAAKKINENKINNCALENLMNFIYKNFSIHRVLD